MNIFEVQFDREVASITQRKYKFDDMKNVDVTLENYQGKTADETITSTFDMVRVR